MEHTLALIMLRMSGLASRPHVDERPRDEDASAVTQAREARPLSLSSRYVGYVEQDTWNVD